MSKGDSLGIRIPNHFFTGFIQKLNKPIITTSVNFTGEKPANKISEINKRIAKKLRIIIDAGELSGKSSILIREGKILERKL